VNYYDPTGLWRLYIANNQDNQPWVGVSWLPGDTFTWGDIGQQLFGDRNHFAAYAIGSVDTTQTVSNAGNLLLCPLSSVMSSSIKTGGTYGIKNFDDKLKKVSALIRSLANYIIKAANVKRVDAQVLAGVIFAENMLNVNFVDTYLEYPLSWYLYFVPFSLGVAQVKLDTAKYVEDQGYMPAVKGKWIGLVYYNANQIRATILQDNYICILYAAAYLALIADMWVKEFPTIRVRPDIWGSLYNLGHNKPPHANPQPRYPFGVFVGEYYGYMGKLLYGYQ